MRGPAYILSRLPGSSGSGSGTTSNTALDNSKITLTYSDGAATDSRLLDFTSDPAFAASPGSVEAGDYRQSTGSSNVANQTYSNFYFAQGFNVAAPAASVGALQSNPAVHAFGRVYESNRYSPGNRGAIVVYASGSLTGLTTIAATFTDNTNSSVWTVQGVLTGSTGSTGTLYLSWVSGATTIAASDSFTLSGASGGSATVSTVTVGTGQLAVEHDVFINAQSTTGADGGYYQFPANETDGLCVGYVSDSRSSVSGPRGALGHDFLGWGKGGANPESNNWIIASIRKNAFYLFYDGSVDPTYAPPGTNLPNAFQWQLNGEKQNAGVCNQMYWNLGPSYNAQYVWNGIPGAALGKTQNAGGLILGGTGSGTPFGYDGYTQVFGVYMGNAYSGCDGVNLRGGSNATNTAGNLLGIQSNAKGGATGSTYSQAITGATSAAPAVFTMAAIGSVANGQVVKLYGFTGAWGALNGTVGVVGGVSGATFSLTAQTVNGYAYPACNTAGLAAYSGNGGTVDNGYASSDWAWDSQAVLNLSGNAVPLGASTLIPMWTNKPGSGATANPAFWVKVISNGVTAYIPAFA